MWLLISISLLTPTDPTLTGVKEFSSSQQCFKTLSNYQTTLIKIGIDARYELDENLNSRVAYFDHAGIAGVHYCTKAP